MTSDRAAALLTGPRGRAVCAYAAWVDRDEVHCWTYGMVLPDESGAAAALGAELHAADVDRLALLEDEAALIEPLRRAVQDAMYWQPPFAYEALLCRDEVLAALEPIAEALVASPAAQWWFTPLDRPNQFGCSFGYDGPEAPPVLDPGALSRLRDRLRREQQVRPWSSDPLHDASGDWWSTPHQAVAPSSRALAGLPCVGLVLVEECSGDFEEALVWSVEVDSAARVYEIDGPADWVHLVRAHPLDVSRSKRGDWARTTGRDGAWAMPDWHAVSLEYDAVHLTAAGYLATATRALGLGGGRATVMANFSPDETYWLRDVVRFGPAARWRAVEDEAGNDVWRPAP